MSKINRLSIPTKILNGTLLAIDPDTNYSALAVYEKGQFSNCLMLSGSLVKQCDQFGEFLSITTPSFCVIEGQQIYKGAPRPNDILLLASFAAALAGVFLESESCENVNDFAMPLPFQWKGSVRKEIDHPRTFKKLGWDYKSKGGYAYPTNLRGHKASDWKHLTDALGIGLWALEIAQKQQTQQLAKQRIKNRRRRH